MEYYYKTLIMKTAMQELLDWLNKQPKVPMSRDLLVSKILISMEKEQQQIISAFDMGKSRAYATADLECEVKFGFQFYAEIYNVQPGDEVQCGVGKNSI